MDKKTIIWKKWDDPYKPTIDDWPDSDDPPYKDNYQNNMPMKVIATPMGMIPLTEQSTPSKLFNFWVVHTSFNLSKSIADIMEKIEGVETLDIWTRYRARVAIGEVFNTRVVIRNINTAIKEYLDKHASSS